MTAGGMEVPAPPPPPSADTPSPNPFQRIVDVLFSPGEAFASIARRPDWVVPLLIIAIISLVSGVLVATHLDFRSLAREAMETNPRMSELPPERVNSAIRVTSAIMRVSAYVSPVLALVALLVVTAVLLLSVKLLGGEGEFLQAFSVTLYAWYPRIIKGLIGTIIVLTRKSVSIFDLQNPLMSNLGFLFDPKTQPLPYAAGSALDIFNIWTLVLLVIGFAAVSRMSRARTALVVVGWWILANLFTLIGPALQTLRR